MAHPRSRGEHLVDGVLVQVVGGSSPLTRGARLCRRRLWPLVGAHPRSRGEHLIPPATVVVRPGSSPLTRGALADLVRPIPAWRLIPAHAGSTQDSPLGVMYIRAHPRSRGEHVGLDRTSDLLSGSSPLTRGAQAIVRPEATRVRLIPAHAGSTRSGLPHRHAGWAHPRSRGEHDVSNGCFEMRRGSSPLTRGAPIPAWIQLPSGGAHPRSRGEHLRRGTGRWPRWGSSPLTRGARPGGATAAANLGLIPAHAGSTLTFGPLRRLGGAHPRSRGEHPKT